MHAPESAPTAPAPATLEPVATMRALDAGVVVRWWQTTAFLQVAGPDAATLLDGLCTQAVERIEPGAAVLGLFLDAKARIIAPTVLHRTPDAAWADPRTAESIAGSPVLLLETLPDLVEPLRRHLAKYRLRAKATIDAVELATFAVVGDGAEAWGAPVADDVAGPISAVTGAWTELREQVRPTRVYVGPVDACAAQVRAAADADGVGLADPDAFEADRIEHAVASLHDLLPGRMPAEVGGMRAAVALDAGCYLGQEPVARLHYRGHANRTLRRLRSSGDVTPAPAPLAQDGSPDIDVALALRRPADTAGTRPAGRLTTWARHPQGGTVALAVLRREVARGETVVLAGTDISFEVTDEPSES